MTTPSFSHTANTDRLATLRLHIENALRRLPVIAQVILRVAREQNSEADRLATLAVTSKTSVISPLIDGYSARLDANYQLPDDVMEQLRQIFTHRADIVEVTEGIQETTKVSCPFPHCPHFTKPSLRLNNT